MNTSKRTSYLIKRWSLLWTSWVFLLLLPIILTLAAHKLGLSINPPHIYITLAIIFFNGLVFSPIILGSRIDTGISLLIGLLVGLAQWFFIYKLGRLWLLNLQNLRWYYKPLFPIFLVSYYAITGVLSIGLLAIAMT